MNRDAFESIGGGEAQIHGCDPVLASPFRVGEAAAGALAAGGVAAAEFWKLRGGRAQTVSVDARAAAASLLSFMFQRIDSAPQMTERGVRATTALYPARDGHWIHLHGGFPHLRDGTLAELGCADDPDAVAAAVRERDAQELEDALAARGMCGAMARTGEEWLAHPQGRAMAKLPPVEVIRIGDSPPETPRFASRPLEGMRVLDLTRVLAGPSCARTLAEHGAEVLRVAAPHLPFIEPFVIDTGHGKRSAHVDLRDAEGVETLRGLVRGADVFSQGYRAGALERRGFGPEQLAELRPGIVVASINCYGHEGPWAARPGWEQLAQTVSGIAVEQGAPGDPTLIPAAACDYVTGYLAACGVMRALVRRATEGGSYHVRASLVQTALWLRSLGRVDPADARALEREEIEALSTDSETAWGRIRHLTPVTRMSETAPQWLQPPVPLGTHEARWSH
ncbi:MAG: CoA transferase [Deltaproteobacteria bacterium]|nr:CoA transferase [Deltaproteobacteria bacterium]